MMGAELDHYLNNTHSSFSNASKNYNVSEKVSSSDNVSPLDNESEERFTDDFYTRIMSIAIFVICSFGALGNGAIIWILGFQMKRNPFITYILSLAVADLGTLLSVIFNTSWYTFIARPDAILMVSFYLVLLMCSASQFFATTISINRCAAVYFPLWHHSKRPPHLSTIVCVLIWALSILRAAISCTLKRLKVYATNLEECYPLITNAVICLPVMSVATVCLFIKVCLKAQQHRRGKLLTIVLLTLLFFLLFAFPVNVIYILSVLGYKPVHMRFAAGLLACVNSSINPVIYFLVGNQWKSRRQESTKLILQKVFKEGEISTEETSVEIRV